MRSESLSYYVYLHIQYIANQFPMQMQMLHPRFLYHEEDWVLRHITINHLAAMSKKFKRMAEDPNVEIHCQYLAR